MVSSIKDIFVHSFVYNIAGSIAWQIGRFIAPVILVVSIACALYLLATPAVMNHS